MSGGFDNSNRVHDAQGRTPEQGPALCCSSSGLSSLSPLSYTILDPTGNITALVESPVEVPLQPSVAAEIMRRHPEVEQVGFVRFLSSEKTGSIVGMEAASGFDTASWNITSSGNDDALNVSSRVIHAQLRMAGGEFCGNASMCAAALYVMRRDADQRFVSRLNGSRLDDSFDDSSEQVFLEVSGAGQPVEVHLRRFLSADISGSDACSSDEIGSDDIVFSTAVKMTPALRIEKQLLAFESLRDSVTLVRMQGISHLILETSSPFFCLLQDREAAERAAKEWCRTLQADGLGLMFLDRTSEKVSSVCHLTPLVYVPGSGTVFWEHSCASGTASAGMALACSSSAPVQISFEEPGGTLHVESDPLTGETWLRGRVQFVSSHVFTC